MNEGWYRGVVVEIINMRDEYGNVYQGERLRYTKVYRKPGIAKGQATIMSNRQTNVKETYVEEATEWTRLT